VYQTRAIPSNRYRHFSKTTQKNDELCAKSVTADTSHSTEASPSTTLGHNNRDTEAPDSQRSRGSAYLSPPSRPPGTRRRRLQRLHSPQRRGDLPHRQGRARRGTGGGASARVAGVQGPPDRRGLRRGLRRRRRRGGPAAGGREGGALDADPPGAAAGGGPGPRGSVGGDLRLGAGRRRRAAGAVGAGARHGRTRPARPADGWPRWRCSRGGAVPQWHSSGVEAARVWWGA